MVRQCYLPNLVPKLIPHMRKSFIRSTLPPYTVQYTVLSYLTVMHVHIQSTFIFHINAHVTEPCSQRYSMIVHHRNMSDDPSSLSVPDPQFLVSEEDIEEDVDGPTTRLHPSSHPHTHPTTTSHSKGVIFVERRGECSFMGQKTIFQWYLCQ